MAALIGVDVGGTFTDVVVVDSAGMRSWKTPTTSDQSVAVSEALSGEKASTFLHGTTAATNTLLEGRGAKVALVTNEGYEDLIEIGRQDRPSLYDSLEDRPEPLVPRDRRHTSLADVGDVDIVAIVLLDSYQDPSEELAMSALTDVPTVVSSDISPAFREYERLATTVLSAYLTPSVATYLSRLDESVDIGTKLVMTSSGGLIPFDDAGSAAGRLVLSGPAGGAVAAAAVGEHHGHGSVISFDMGGTSTDVARLTGGIARAGSGHRVAGRVNRVPSIPIKTIGAGGGSVAWVDSGGALRVGPVSAGAHPGPAVYGRGGSELTVTDANVLAGHIPADLSLGGSVILDVTAGRAAADTLAARLGMGADQVVGGVIDVVDAHMERALRAVTIEEGSDPRDSALVAFGGAGGLHAARLAKRLGMSKVLVPPHSGVLSALGLLMATPRADSARTVMLSDGDERLAQELNRIESDASAKYSAMFATEPLHRGSTLDVRYVGQSHEIEIEAAPDWHLVRSRFHQAHSERFGFSRDEPIEIVNVRATADGEAPLKWADLPALDGGEAVGGEGVWLRSTLPAGFEIQGPAVVVEDNSATLLEAGNTMTVLPEGTLEISV